MTQKLEQTKSGVVCLHCGMPTPLQNSANFERAVAIAAAPRTQISLVRCAECGKEAPYLARDIVLLRKTPAAVPCAA